MQSDQQTNETFKQFKIEEQKLLKQMFPKYEINLSEDYNRWDLIEDKRKYVLEVKIREFSMDYFKTKYHDNPLIEEEKFWINWNKAQELDYKFIYVFGFHNADGKIEGYKAYDLQHINAAEFWEKKLWCPKNSINPKSPKVLKDCYIINHNLFLSGGSYTRIYTTPF